MAAVLNIPHNKAKETDKSDYSQASHVEGKAETTLPWDISRGKQASSLKKSLGAERVTSGGRAELGKDWNACLPVWPWCRVGFLSEQKKNGR